MKPISLETAFKTGLVKRNDGIYYPLPVKLIELTEVQTGWIETQSFYTETDMKWRLDRYRRELILVAKDATRQELLLDGEVGYSEGLNAIDYICEGLYLNTKLATKVISMDEGPFYQLTKCNKTSPTRPYWLNSQFECGDDEYSYFGIRYIQSNSIKEGDLYTSDSFGWSEQNSVRPVVFLKSDLMVIGGTGTENNPWVLKSLEE